MKIQIKLLSLLSALAFGLTGCNEFDRSYDKIDGEFARSLSVHYLEPDMAPGDTVTLRSYWDGKPINAANVKWGVSWQFYQNKYGKNIVLDSQALDKWIVEPMHEVAKIDSMQVFEMRFVIPDSIMRKSPGIPENWVEELNKYGAKELPASILDKIPADKNSLLTLLDSLSDLSDTQKKAFISSENGKMIDGVFQFLSVRFKVYFDYTADGGFNGRLLHSVRYQSKFNAIEGVYVNKRPILSGAKLYKVSGSDVQFFDPSSQSAEEVIPVTDSIVDATYSIGKMTFSYDKSKTYFLEVTTDSRDSVCSTEEDFGGVVGTHFEEYTSYWFYDKNASKSIGMTQQEDYNDEKSGVKRAIYKLTFGEDDEIVHGKPMKFYLEQGDRKFGTSYRPLGRDMKMFKITIR